MSVRVMSWVWDQELPPNGKIVLLAIADHCDDYGGGAWPSQALLARKTGYGTRQIKHIIDALVASGVLKVELHAGGPKVSRADRRPNLYTILMDQPVAISRGEFSTTGATPELRQEVIEAFHRRCYHCQRPGEDLDPDGSPWEVDRLVAGAAGGRYTRDNVVLSCQRCNRSTASRGEIITPRYGGTSQHRRGEISDTDGGTSITPEPSIEPSVEPPTTRSSSSATSFDAFWEAYPRKVGKDGARRVWMRAVKSTPAETIIAGARAYRDDPNREPEFTAHPSTWLNRGSWSDEPLPARGGGQSGTSLYLAAAMPGRQIEAGR